jgi:hypothetical protein
MARTRGLGKILGALCALGIGTLCAEASAQQTVYDTRAPEGAGNNGADTHLFRPAVDSKGFLSVNGADILGANDISFGLVLDYGRNLLRTRGDEIPKNGPNDCTPDSNAAGLSTGCPATYVNDPTHGTGVPALIQNSFQGTFGFNYGIANRLVVGLNVPVILMTGDAAYDIGRGAPPNGPGNYISGELNQQSISTMALHAKVRILRPEKVIGLAGLVQVGFPIGSASQNLGGDPGVWYWPQFIAEAVRRDRSLPPRPERRLPRPRRRQRALWA